jgi:hypothetical protein
MESWGAGIVVPQNSGTHELALFVGHVSMAKVCFSRFYGVALGSRDCRIKLAKAAVRLGYPDQRQVSIALRTLMDRSASGAFG